MTKEQEEEKEYFYQLRKILVNSSKYIGSVIEQVDVLNMIYFKKSNFYIIDKFIRLDEHQYLIEFSFNGEDEGDDLLEIVIIKDINKGLFIGYVIDDVDLFSDKYLYYIQKLEQEKYDLLIKSKNHKGLFIYEI